jgi:putative endonuclease
VFGENIAAEFLKLQGLDILERNFFFKKKEIDIIAGSPGLVVFVEVKMRETDLFGAPVHAVDEKKLGDIAFVAQAYLRRSGEVYRDVRFDVIAIHFEQGGSRMVLEHFAGLEPPRWTSHL